MLIAHSKNEENGIKEQSYSEHINNVFNFSISSVKEMEKYMFDKKLYNFLLSIVSLASEYHDLGKLDENSQEILNGKVKEKMLNHVDAGCCYLMNKYNETKNNVYLYSAWLVNAHHKGLIDSPIGKENKIIFRDIRKLAETYKQFLNNIPIHEYTNKKIEYYLEKHNESVKLNYNISNDNLKINSITLRIALSCLVNADREDTGNHYKTKCNIEKIELNPKKRLESLDEYVKKLSKNKINERNKIRIEVYNACKNSKVYDNIVYCASEVGTGKTLSSMAYALNVSSKFNNNKIIYVAPFSNIISQTVKVYRKSLKINNEITIRAISENHHAINLVDENGNFDNLASIYAKEWEAPIVITTAVQLFETFASNHPSKLLKLHKIVGSVIIIDESDACMQPIFWKIAWKWIKYLTENFGCRVVLSSGTLTKIWEIDGHNGIVENKENINSIIPKELSIKTFEKEKERINIENLKEKQTIDSLINKVFELNGSVLIIVNTLMNAAVLAQEIKNRSGDVFHLSTSLSPKDREIILNKIRKKQEDKNSNYFVVGTSCIQAGIDLSFKYGFRESCSYSSLYQTGGRVNRNYEYGNKSMLYNFEFEKNQEYITSNPYFNSSIKILEKLIENGKIGTEYCTEAIRLELIDRDKDVNNLLKYEKLNKFKEMSENFKIIESLTKAVVVNKSLIDNIKENKIPSYRQIVKNSVQIWKDKIEKYPIESVETIGASKIFKSIDYWSGGYDKDFLGYMSEILYQKGYKGVNRGEIIS